MNKWVSLGIVVFFALPVVSRADTEIKFTQRELSAGSVLMRPELNRLEIDGQTATFSPAPSLRAIGVDEIPLALNFTGLSQLAGIQFNHLRTGAPDIRFDGTDLLLTVPLEDQTAAARTRLGTISVKNGVLRARLAWRARSSGASELFVASTAFNGTLTGTGALRPSFMISLVHKLLLNTLEAQTSKIINRPGVQESILLGLLTWAKFSTGQEWREILPGTVSFYTDGAESGLRYRVQ